MGISKSTGKKRKSLNLILKDSNLEVKYSELFPKGSIETHKLIFTLVNMPVEGMTITGLRTRGNIIAKLENLAEKTKDKHLHSLDPEIKKLELERIQLINRLNAINLQLESKNKPLNTALQLDITESLELKTLLSTLLSPKAAVPVMFQNNQILNEFERILKEINDYLKDKDI